MGLNFSTLTLKNQIETTPWLGQETSAILNLFNIINRVFLQVDISRNVLRKIEGNLDNFEGCLPAIMNFLGEFEHSASQLDSIVKEFEHQNQELIALKSASENRVSELAQKENEISTLMRSLESLIADGQRELREARSNLENEEAELQRILEKNEELAKTNNIIGIVAGAIFGPAPFIAMKVWTEMAKTSREKIDSLHDLINSYKNSIERYQDECNEVQSKMDQVQSNLSSARAEHAIEHQKTDCLKELILFTTYFQQGLNESRRLVDEIISVYQVEKDAEYPDRRREKMIQRFKERVEPKVEAALLQSVGFFLSTEPIHLSIGQ